MSRPDIFGLAGTVLDARYRIEEVVGEGGFGVVYRAMQVNFDEPCAIKVLKLPTHLTEEQRGLVVSTFRAEGKHLRKLSLEHPAFVRALDAGITEAVGLPAPYLVLEWLDGEPLEQELRRRRGAAEHGRSLTDAMMLLEPIFGALAHAHAQRVAHRDVKPANIFLIRTSKGVTTKLLDFGMAKVMTETGTEAINIATQGAMAGFTPPYAAPEQWNKKLGATGPWTDVYALALVMVELLTDQMALIGDDMPQFMAATMDPERPTPLTRGAKVSAAVEAVFANALRIHPKDRIRNAREFWNCLAAAVREDMRAEEAHGTPTIALAPLDLPELPEMDASVGPPKASTSVTPAVTARKHEVTAAPINREVPQSLATGRSGFPVRVLVLAVLITLGIGAAAMLMNKRLVDVSGTAAVATSSVPMTVNSSTSSSPSNKLPKPKVPTWFSALEAAPDRSPPPSSTPQAQWLRLRGAASRLIKEKKYMEAKASLLQALPVACGQIGETDPACPETYKQLAIVAVSMGKLDEAEERLRKAVDLLTTHGNPDQEDFNESRRFLVAVLRKMGKEDEALKFDIPAEPDEEPVQLIDASAPEDASTIDASVPEDAGADAAAKVARPVEKISNDWKDYDELIKILERERKEEEARRQKALEKSKH